MCEKERQRETRETREIETTETRERETRETRKTRETRETRERREIDLHVIVDATHSNGIGLRHDFSKALLHKFVILSRRTKIYQRNHDVCKYS